MELDTNSDIFPEGTYLFRVSDIPEEGETKGGYMFFKFMFTATLNGETMPYQERFMRWLMGPLMRALGFDEPKPGKFIWEPTMALGREIVATIRHETIEKGPSAGQVVARMKDIKSISKSINDSMSKSSTRAAMAAQAPAEEEIPF